MLANVHMNRLSYKEYIPVISFYYRTILFTRLPGVLLDPIVASHCTTIFIYTCQTLVVGLPVYILYYYIFTFV